jgi:hypothetical protein
VLAQSGLRHKLPDQGVRLARQTLTNGLKMDSVPARDPIARLCMSAKLEQPIEIRLMHTTIAHGPDAPKAAAEVRAREFFRAYGETVEKLERQQAAPPPEPALGPGLTDIEIEQRIGRQDMAKYERMMRERPGEYWASPSAQAAYRDAIDRATTAPPVASGEPPAVAGLVAE